MYVERAEETFFGGEYDVFAVKAYARYARFQICRFNGNRLALICVISDDSVFECDVRFARIVNCNVDGFGKIRVCNVKKFRSVAVYAQNGIGGEDVNVRAVFGGCDTLAVFDVKYLYERVADCGVYAALCERIEFIRIRNVLDSR